jgi:lysyl-tRNA synthetase, class II
MASQSEIRNIRIQKKEILEAKGVSCYPAHTNRTTTLAGLKEDFDIFLERKTLQTVAGRVLAIRGQGAILFVSLDDGTGSFQMVLHAGDTPDEFLSFFTETVDIGDFIEFSGICFVTKKGEPSILVSAWKMLTKSLLPLPDKWHGLQDEEERFRKRYLDILSNQEAKEMFVKKARFWQVIRNFLEDHEFMAVDTPVLELTTGGAETTPFATKHLDYDLDVFLRISVGELWQKRLMAAGYPKTYEIGRVFRNEGSSPNHLQEFTNFEFYWGYADYKMGMTLVRDLYRKIALDVFGTTQFSTRGHSFDMAAEWTEISYVAEIERQTGLNILQASKEEVEVKLKELHVVSDGVTLERLIDSLWKYCRKQISGPAFVINYPDFMQPLAKRSQENPLIVEQFQVLLGGAELGKGYSELNDPIDQRQRFEHQQNLEKAGDKEAMMADYDFVEMLEYGMPPTCGFGAGERLFAFLVDKPIRETTLFPLMRPKKE